MARAADVEIAALHRNLQPYLSALHRSAFWSPVVPVAPVRSGREGAGGRVDQGFCQLDKRSRVHVPGAAQKAGRTLLQFQPDRDFGSVNAAAGLNPAHRLRNTVQEHLSPVLAEVVQQDRGTAATTACARRSCSSSGHHEERRSAGVSAPTRAASMKRIQSVTS
jgi:hypothetical protein